MTGCSPPRWAPFGVAVQRRPDAPRALDRITALRRPLARARRHPGREPGRSRRRRPARRTLQLLELDTVALCLPVTLAARSPRRVLRALRPLRPTALVATRADEVDLLGGVVAVAIDRACRSPTSSEGAERGTIIGADAQRIAEGLLADAGHLPPAPPVMPSGRTVPVPEIRRSARARSGPQPSSPTVVIAAGPAHLAPPWITPALRDRRR